jgi:hypothetical protein
MAFMSFMTFPYTYSYFLSPPYPPQKHSHNTPKQVGVKVVKVMKVVKSSKQPPRHTLSRRSRPANRVEPLQHQGLHLPPTPSAMSPRRPDRAIGKR